MENLMNIILMATNLSFAIFFFVLAIVFKEGQEKDKKVFIVFALAFGSQITGFCLDLAGNSYAALSLLGIFIPTIWWLSKAFFPNNTTTIYYQSPTKN
jgi:hypothetical protein